jgi:hypothetical protein
MGVTLEAERIGTLLRRMADGFQFPAIVHFVVTICGQVNMRRQMERAQSQNHSSHCPKARFRRDRLSSIHMHESMKQNIFTVKCVPGSSGCASHKEELPGARRENRDRRAAFSGPWHQRPPGAFGHAAFNVAAQKDLRGHTDAVRREALTLDSLTQ